MAMDPELWGDLQHHINLPESVYLKLPLREFFLLRGVCKAWNRVARDRRCVTDPLRKPCITMVRKQDAAQDVLYVENKYSLYGMLTFDIATSFGRWKWNRQLGLTKPFHILCKAFSAKGLAFDGAQKPATECPIVYDAHTQRAHIIPQPPNTITAGAHGYSALGMAVDNSVMPHTFKIILGSIATETQIYDSVTSAWTTTASRLAPAGRPSSNSTCLHCDDSVYIWSQVDQILVYSLKDDVWSVLAPSAGNDVTHDGDGGAVGYWKGRVFTVMEDDWITTFVVGVG